MTSFDDFFLVLHCMLLAYIDPTRWSSWLKIWLEKVITSSEKMEAAAEVDNDGGML